MKTKNIILALAFILLNIFFTKSQNSESEYEAFIKQRVNEMIEYQNQQDREFTDFLKESWLLYSAVSGIKNPNPGPPKPVIYEPSVVPKPQEIPQNYTIPTQKEPEPKKTEPEKKLEIGNSGNIDFFGGKYSINEPVSKIVLNQIDENSIARAWSTLAKSDYRPFIEDCLMLKNKLQLSDWGYIQFTEKAARLLSKRDTDDEIVFGQVFILLQSNYKVKMARVDNKLTLLISTKQTLYETSYVNVGFDRYFIITNNPRKQVSTINTYNRDFASANTPINMEIEDMPLLKSNKIQRIVESSKYGNIEASVNKNLVDYYNSFPQTEIPVYMNSRATADFDRYILPQFRRMIEGKSQQEGAEILLDFIQNSFAYATDEQQFGYEKPFFIDECFFYPYTDCEDRAILYGYLVKQLLQLDIVLLQYPEHIATGIHFPGEHSGDYIIYNNKEYTICDPTYTNAPIGTCMPEYVNTKPSIYMYQSRTK